MFKVMEEATKPACQRKDGWPDVSSCDQVAHQLGEDRRRHNVQLRTRHALDEHSSNWVLSLLCLRHLPEHPTPTPPSSPAEGSHHLVSCAHRDPPHQLRPLRCVCDRLSVRQTLGCPIVHDGLATGATSGAAEHGPGHVHTHPHPHANPKPQDLTTRVRGGRCAHQRHEKTMCEPRRARGKERRREHMALAHGAVHVGKLHHKDASRERMVEEGRLCARAKPQERHALMRDSLSSQNATACHRTPPHTAASHGLAWRVSGARSVRAKVDMGWNGQKEELRSMRWRLLGAGDGPTRC